MKGRFPWTESVGSFVTAMVGKQRQMGQELGRELATTAWSWAVTPQPIPTSNPYEHVACPQYVQPPQEAFDWHSGTATSG